MPRRSPAVLADFDPEIERTLRQRRRLHFQPPPKMKLSEDGLPKATQVPTGTLKPTFTAKNFRIESGFYNLIRKDQFGGLTTEDPADHINHFCDLCQLITNEEVTPDQLKYMMFPHSLKGKAYAWLQTLKGIDDWDKLVLAFYHKFFPPERTSMLRMQITGFRQRLNESLYDAWDRYKTLERQCPHHGFGKGFIAMTFYNALTSDSRRILDSAANGRFDSVEVDDAWDVIERMATHSISYSQSVYTTVGAVSGDTLFQQSVTSQIEDLKSQLAGLKVDTPSPISAVQT